MLKGRRSGSFKKVSILGYMDDAGIGKLPPSVTAHSPVLGGHLRMWTHPLILSQSDHRSGWVTREMKSGHSRRPGVIFRLSSPGTGHILLVSALFLCRTGWRGSEWKNTPNCLKYLVPLEKAPMKFMTLELEKWREEALLRIMQVDVAEGANTGNFIPESMQWDTPRASTQHLDFTWVYPPLKDTDWSWSWMTRRPFRTMVQIVIDFGDVASGLQECCIL